MLRNEGDTTNHKNFEIINYNAIRKTIHFFGSIETKTLTRRILKNLDLGLFNKPLRVPLKNESPNWKWDKFSYELDKKAYKRL